MDQPSNRTQNVIRQRLDSDNTAQTYNKTFMTNPMDYREESSPYVYDRLQTLKSLNNEVSPLR